MIPLGVLGAATPRQSGGGGGDPYWDYVVALLHCDGSPGANVFTDVKGKSWTAAGGNPEISNVAGTMRAGQSIRRPYSESLIRCNSNPDFEFPGDFTVEFDFYPVNNASLHRAALGFDVTGGLHIGTRNGKLAFWLNNSGGIYETELTASLNQRHHVAVYRRSGVIYAALDGVQSSLTMDHSGTIPAGSVYLGWRVSSYSLPGYYDEIRITNGVARYDGNFTVPTDPYPDGP